MHEKLLRLEDAKKEELAKKEDEIKKTLSNCQE